MVSRVTRRAPSRASVEVTAVLHARTVARLEAENAALRAALQRYVDSDAARDNAGDTPARQARAALGETT